MHLHFDFFLFELIVLIGDELLVPARHFLSAILAILLKVVVHVALRPFPAALAIRTKDLDAVDNLRLLFVILKAFALHRSAAERAGS